MENMVQELQCAKLEQRASSRKRGPIMEARKWSFVIEQKTEEKRMFEGEVNVARQLSIEQPSVIQGCHIKKMMQDI